MKKQVIFTGGLHGAGKTSSCQELKRLFRYETAKQRRILIEVGKKKGLKTWEEIGVLHKDLIDEAGELLVAKF